MGNVFIKTLLLRDVIGQPDVFNRPLEAMLKLNYVRYSNCSYFFDSVFHFHA